MILVIWLVPLIVYLFESGSLRHLLKSLVARFTEDSDDVPALGGILNAPNCGNLLVHSYKGRAANQQFLSSLAATDWSGWGFRGHWEIDYFQHTMYWVTLYTVGDIYKCGEVKEGKWQPYGKTYETVLKPIKKPTPMYVAPTSNWISIPLTNTVFGFDFEKNDLVKPYGIGVTSDFTVEFEERHSIVS